MADINVEITRDIFLERESDTKHPGYDREMAFYKLVANGRLEEVRKSWETAPRSDAEIRGVLSDNPVRNAMYHYVAMVTLISRVCICEGLSQDIAYKMSDAYIKKADHQNTTVGIRSVQWEMIEHFTKTMQNIHKADVKSKQVHQCIDYINQHLHDSITVSDLADMVELNETYLSKLFRKEMNMTISEYIRKQKVEEACWLLKYSDKTSIEISTDMSFSSHSYFISVFKKETGVTPKEYRNRYFRSLK